MGAPDNEIGAGIAGVNRKRFCRLTFLAQQPGGRHAGHDGFSNTARTRQKPAMRDASRHNGLRKRTGKGLVTENGGIGDDGRGIIHPELRSNQRRACNRRGRTAVSISPVTVSGS